MKKRIFVQIVKAPKKAWYEKHIGEIFEVSNEHFIDRNNINVYFEETVSVYVVERGDYKQVVVHIDEDEDQRNNTAVK